MPVRVKKPQTSPEENGSRSESRTRRRSALDVAEKQVQDEGFKLPSRPADEVPILPEDLTELSDRDLMRCMQEQLSWAEYAGYRLARGEVQERELDLQINRRAAHTLAGAWTGESSDRVAIAKAEVEEDREIIKLREQHMTAQAYRKIINNLYDAIDRRVNLISRELTRRTSIEPKKGRSSKWGNP